MSLSHVSYHSSVLGPEWNGCELIRRVGIDIEQGVDPVQDDAKGRGLAHMLGVFDESG